MTRELRLWRGSLVVELASNDGYLLQYFRQSGVSRPRRRAGRERRQRLPRRAACRPRSRSLAWRRRADCSKPAKQADLICANNVLAHVPDLNDFVAGLPHPAEARRHDHGGIPAPASPDRRPAVRHDLSRALLVFLAAGGGQGVRAARPARVRRRLPADAWRLAAHPCLPRRCRTAAHRSGSTRDADRTRSRPASTICRPTTASAPPRSMSSARCWNS